MTSSHRHQHRRRTLSAFVRLTLHVLFEASGAADIDLALARWSELLRAALAGRGGPDALAPIFRYLAEVRSRSEHPTLLHKAHELFADQKQVMETIADMFRNEGRNEGLERGRSENLALLRKLLTRTLQARFGALSSGALAEIQQADATTIARWSELVDTSSTLDELLAG